MPSGYTALRVQCDPWGFANMKCTQLISDARIFMASLTHPTLSNNLDENWCVTARIELIGDARIFMASLTHPTLLILMKLGALRLE